MIFRTPEFYDSLVGSYALQTRTLFTNKFILILSISIQEAHRKIFDIQIICIGFSSSMDNDIRGLENDNSFFFLRFR